MARTTLVLTGSLAGKTVVLNRHQFVKGKLTLDGVGAAGAIRYLGRCYQAYPEGSAELAKAQANGVQRNSQASAGSGNTTGVQGRGNEPAGTLQTQGDVQRAGHDAVESASGGSVVVSDRSGSADTGVLPEQVAAIRRAVASFDPASDEFWNEEGLPTVEAVSAAAKLPNVSRKMIEAAYPGFNRELAMNLQEF